LQTFNIKHQNAHCLDMLLHSKLGHKDHTNSGCRNTTELKQSVTLKQEQQL